MCACTEPVRTGVGAVYVEYGRSKWPITMLNHTHIPESHEQTSLVQNRHSRQYMLHETVTAEQRLRVRSVSAAISNAYWCTSNVCRADRTYLYVQQLAIPESNADLHLDLDSIK